MAVSEKSVLRVGDLLDWQVECYLVWLVSVLLITAAGDRVLARVPVGPRHEGRGLRGLRPQPRLGAAPPPRHPRPRPHRRGEGQSRTR